MAARNRADRIRRYEEGETKAQSNTQYADFTSGKYCRARSPEHQDERPDRLSGQDLCISHVCFPSSDPAPRKLDWLVGWNRTKR